MEHVHASVCSQLKLMLQCEQFCAAGVKRPLEGDGASQMAQAMALDFVNTRVRAMLNRIIWNAPSNLATRVNTPQV